MQVSLRQLAGTTGEKVQAMVADANLLKTLPWGPGITVVSDKDASVPEDGRYGNEVVIEIQGQQWSWLGARNVSADGYRVHWLIEVEVETGKVLARAVPESIPFEYPFEDFTPARTFNIEDLIVVREIGQIEPLVQIFDNATSGLFPWMQLDSRWVERSVAVAAFDVLGVMIQEAKERLARTRTTPRTGAAITEFLRLLRGDGDQETFHGVLCGRILRGTSPTDFQTLTDDPERKLIMLMGTDGLLSLVGKSGYEMLVALGYDLAYIRRLVAEGKQFKLLVMEPGQSALQATWGNVITMAAQAYPQAEFFLRPRLEQLCTMSFEDIEASAGYRFAEVDKNGPLDPRFMTLERLLKTAGHVSHVRAFLYHTCYLRELFSGDGYIHTADGHRVMQEFMAPNAPIRELGVTLLMDLDVQIPEVK